MRKWYTYIIMLATVLFGSCNLEDTLFPEQECETEKEAVNVRLILSMMEGRGLSRAPLTDNPTSEDYLDEEPLGNEYYINPYDVEVLIFNANTNVFVERATMVRATPTDNYHEYQLDGTLTEVNGKTDYHVVLLANLHGSSYCNNFTTPTTGTTMSTFLEGLTYTSYNAAFTGKLLEEDSTERIPMWGITTTKLTDGTTISLNLLRSMAKIRVNLELEADGYTLSKVTLNNANPGGFFTPSMEKGITTAGITANVSEVRIPEGLTQLESLAFEKVDDSYIIYVPECYTFSEDNEGAKTAETYITVELKDNGGNVVDLEGNDKLYFREYRATDETAGIVNGSFFDIVRNYFYDYTITGVQDNSGMELTLSVKDWTDVTETFNYESELSYNDGGWTNNFGREGNTIVLKSSSEANASTVTAEYNFQINTPQTIEWMAVLEDPSMKFEFDMDKTSGKGTAEGENAIQRTVKGELLVTGSNLTLGVKAVDPSEKGQYDAKLHVYVTYSGKTIELNLVDGQESTLQHFTIRHSKL